MSTAFERGIVLFNQNRYDLADREFRQELAESPDNALAHAFLAFCLSSANKDEDDAQREPMKRSASIPARRFAITCAGGSSASKTGTRKRKRPPKKRSGSTRGTPTIWACWRASSWAGAGGPRRSLPPIGAGPRPGARSVHKPSGHGPGSARPQGRGGADAGSALANDPENALTHANQGWALLHRGDHAKALEHFREALRIDPELDWARAGIVEALKARHLIYRLMLRFFLWIGRQASVAQWIDHSRLSLWAEDSRPASPASTPHSHRSSSP